MAVRRLQADGESGLDELLAAYQVRAMRVAYGITRDWHLAEEVVADGFMTAYTKREELDPDRSIEAWLMKVIANRALSAVRRRSALRRALAALRGQERRAVDPGDVAIENADATAIRAVLARSSAQDRTVLVLRYYLDLPPSEIAEQLGWPEGTVKTRLHRAREHFRAALSTEGLEPFGAGAVEGGPTGGV